MEESADQLILEYLAVVGDVAHHHLGTRERLDFMTRLRARIEEHRRGSGDPAEVREVLARFGDPERLVLRERRRLDGMPPAPSPARTVRRGGRTIRTFEWSPAGAARARRAARSRRAARRRPAPGDRAAGLGAFGRRRGLELGALTLLGPGGLLLPVPLWPFGAVLTCASRAWTTRDKLIGLVGPLAVTAIGVVWYAVGQVRADQAFDVGTMTAAITGAGPSVLRFAGPAGAVHLGVRLLRAAGIRR